jgi:hypothetical protein
LWPSANTASKPSTLWQVVHLTISAAGLKTSPARVARYEGAFHRFSVSRGECDAMILHARIKGGWI